MTRDDFSKTCLARRSLLCNSGGRAPCRGKAVGTALRGDAIALENGVCRYEIGVDGKNRALVGLADGKDYGEPGQPFMVAGRGRRHGLRRRSNWRAAS